MYNKMKMPNLLIQFNEKKTSGILDNIWIKKFTGIPKE